MVTHSLRSVHRCDGVHAAVRLFAAAEDGGGDAGGGARLAWRLAAAPPPVLRRLGPALRHPRVPRRPGPQVAAAMMGKLVTGNTKF